MSQCTQDNNLQWQAVNNLENKVFRFTYMGTSPKPLPSSRTSKPPRHRSKWNAQSAHASRTVSDCHMSGEVSPTLPCLHPANLWILSNTTPPPQTHRIACLDHCLVIWRQQAAGGGWVISANDGACRSPRLFKTGYGFRIIMSTYCCYSKRALGELGWVSYCLRCFKLNYPAIGWQVLSGPQQHT